MQLPSNLSVREFDQSFRLKPELWRSAVIECCDKHGIVSEDFVAYSEGTNLVASVNSSHIIKIFPPFLKHQWDSEHRVLRHLNGKITIDIPDLVADGKRSDGWHYVIVTKLEGITFEGVWHQFSLSEKRKILKQVGQIMKSVHQVEVGELKSLQPDWSLFLKAQKEKAIERHRRLNMPTWFLNELPAYMAKYQDLIPTEFRSVVLTGEYTPFNMMTDVIKNSVVTGMIDFGDAMIGYNEYDLLGPSLFLAEGNPELIYALFEGYGLSSKQIDDELRHRLMVLTVLHRYSNLDVQLRIPEWEKRVHSIVDLEKIIWPKM